MTTAKFCRIFELNPTDDFITKREAVIKDLAALFVKKNTVSDLMRRATQACSVFFDQSVYSNDYGSEVEGIIQKRSASFVGEGSELEMGVCGALAALQMAKSNIKANPWGSTEVFVLSVWSILSFIPDCGEPKLNELQNALKDASRTRILNAAKEVRVRKSVPDFDEIGDEPITKKIFEEATTETIDVLRSNAAFDREELDILWWVLSDFSDIFDLPFEDIGLCTKAISKGLELGKYMRTYPVQAYRNLLLRGIDKGRSYTMQELFAELGNDLETLAAAFEDNTTISNNPSIFPLLYCLINGVSDIPGSDVSRPLTEWSARALLESAFINIQSPDRRNL